MSHVSPCIVACVLYNLKCVRENELSTQMWVYVQCFQQDLKFIVSGFKSEAWNILYYSFHNNNNMIVQLKMHTCSLQRFKWSQQNCWCFLLCPNVHQYCEPNSTEGFHGSKEKEKERSWILKVSTAFVKCAVDSACAAVKTRVDVAYLPQTSEFIC